MEVIKETTINVTLVLNEREASWLKGYVQNPAYEHESEEDSMMRKEIFDNLYAQGVQ